MYKMKYSEVQFRRNRETREREREKERRRGVGVRTDWKGEKEGGKWTRCRGTVFRQKNAKEESVEGESTKDGSRKGAK